MGAVLCASCSQPGSVETVEVAKPNLVLIVADTLRADRVHMQRNGKPLMPNLAKLASESLDYRNCRVQATWTKPSMATLFTSLYPEVHKVYYGIDGDLSEDALPETDVLPPSFETFAEFLKSQGYANAGIQSNANIVSHFGFDQGFDSYEYLKYPKFHGNAVTDAALEELSKLPSPRFLYVHYMDAHAPYETPADFVDADANLPSISKEDRKLVENYSDCYRDRIMFEVGITNQRKYGNLSKEGEEYLRAKYDSSVHYLDVQLGRLIDRVRESDPNAIIVVTSDHGEELWEHGSIGHGKTVYEELTRVPLIVYVRGKSPRTVDAPVELVDILPACAALLGLHPRPEWQGRDIATLSGALPVDRPSYSAAMMSIKGSNRDLDAIVLGEEKLIVDKIASNETFINLKNDPGERNGTILEPSHTAAAPLRKMLQDFHSANASHPLRQESSTTSALTPEQQENIRSIGYLK
ncbi:MAG: sulfatase [Candidatus Hydrogenedentes bacterium]|nr:sulfatase [Candidatus Hydrogenedentota bacterium]